MFFKENPFYILGLEENSVDDSYPSSTSPASSPKVKRILQDNQKRSEAEFYWIWDIGKEYALEWVRDIIGGRIFTLSSWNNLSPMTALILELNTLYYGKMMSLEWLLDIERCYQKVNIEEVTKKINQVRQSQGFTTLCDASDMEWWMQNLLYQLGIAFKRAMRGTSLLDVSHILYQMGRQGKRTLVYYQFVSVYEMESFSQREELKGNLVYGLTLLSSHTEQGKQLTADMMEEYQSLMEALYERDGWRAYEPIFSLCRGSGIAFYSQKGKREGSIYFQWLLSLFSFDPTGKSILLEDLQNIEQGRPLHGGAFFKNDTCRVPKSIRNIPQVPLAPMHRNREPIALAMTSIVWLMALGGYFFL